MPVSPNISDDSLELLMDVGFLATRIGLHRKAHQVFGALAYLKPENPSPHIGAAVAYLGEKNYEGAVDSLVRRALAVDEDCSLARSFLGLTLKLAGALQPAREVLGEVLEENRDPTAIAMAEALLNEIDELEEGGVS